MRHSSSIICDIVQVCHSPAFLLLLLAGSCFWGPEYCTCFQCFGQCVSFQLLCSVDAQSFNRLHVFIIRHWPFPRPYAVTRPSSLNNIKNQHPDRDFLLAFINLCTLFPLTALYIISMPGPVLRSWHIPPIFFFQKEQVAIATVLIQISVRRSESCPWGEQLDIAALILAYCMQGKYESESS